MAKKFLVDIDVKGSVSQTNATSSMLKADSTGKIVPAIAGVDYLLEGGGGSANNIQHDVKAGEAINKGQAVYVFTANGTNIVVKKASNSAESTSSKTFGLIDRNVSTNDTAKVITEGLLEGLDTSGATAGDPIWLGTNGNLIFGLANKPTAPAHLVFIGIVTRVQQNNGEIFVKVQNGFETEELHDVIAAGRTTNDVLHWDGSINRYASIVSLLGYTPYNSTNPSGYITSSSLTWSNISSKPTNLSQFTNDLGNYGGWITGITSTMVTNALGYTPYNSTNPSGYITGINSTMVTNALGYTPYNSSNPNGYITSSALSSYLPLSGGTTSGVVDFGPNSGNNNGIGILYGSSGYGRVRFYQDSYNNHSTIHSFGGSWGGGWAGTINIDGQNGVTIGSWNAPDFSVSKGGHTYAKGYRGNANVGGTGEASWHPAGIYCGSTNWMYGTTYKNGSSTSGQGWLYLDWNYGHSVVGVYSSTIYQGVWSMGDAYRLADNGSNTGNLYGLAWSHPNAGGQAGYLTNHGLIHMMYGTAFATISDNIWCRNNITAYSDIRVKENIQVIENAMEKINSIRGVTFTRNDVPDTTQRHAGVIAQEIQKVLPEVISENKSNGHLSVAYGNISALLIQGIKEQDLTIKNLQGEVKELKQIVKYLIDGIAK